LCKAVLNIACVYDDERFLFKQTYLRRRSNMCGVGRGIIQRFRHFLYSGD
jgi:hypothetical protein